MRGMVEWRLRGIGFLLNDKSAIKLTVVAELLNSVNLGIKENGILHYKSMHCYMIYISIKLIFLKMK